MEAVAVVQVNIKLEINQQGVYRLEIIKYLPLSGEYMVKMSELIPNGKGSIQKDCKNT